MTRRLTILATRKEISLLTMPMYPPVPIQNWNWSALDDSTFDYGEACGMGATEMDAVNALLDELETQ